MVVNYEEGSAVSQGVIFRRADSNETAENYWERRSDQLWGRTGEQSPVAGGLPRDRRRLKWCCSNKVRLCLA